MQRSIINKNPLVAIFYLTLFFLYESLSSIYLFLPPLFAVFFVLFIRAMKHDDTFSIVFIIIALIFFEADKGYILFSSIFYFILLYRIVLPRIVHNFGCSSCIKIFYVVMAYLGFYIFTLFISNIFLVSSPDINYYIFYYMIIEFFIVSLL